MSDTVTKRNYVSLADAQAAVTSATLARLDRAEQAIDDYIGYQDKHVPTVFQGTVAAASGKTITDTNPPSQLHQHDGYFAYCVIEIIGGTGVGQVRTISDSSYDNRSITTVDAWTTEPDTTSYYRIYQLGKFPRAQGDVFVNQGSTRFYKAIPDAIKQAVLAQLEFIEAQGDAYFQADDSDITGESMGNYSYTKGSGGQSSTVSMLAPRARNLLRGLKRSGGALVAENPTCL